MGRQPALSPGGGITEAIIPQRLRLRIKGGVALGAAVLVVRRELRPAAPMVDENVAADAVKAEIYVGAGEHSTLAGCQYPEADHVVFLDKPVAAHPSSLRWQPGASPASEGNTATPVSCGSREWQGASRLPYRRSGSPPAPAIRSVPIE